MLRYTKAWLRNRLGKALGWLRSWSLLLTAHSLFVVNRSSCTYGNRPTIYFLKDAMIDHLITRNYLVRTDAVRQVLKCRYCTNGCPRCDRGIYKSTDLAKLTFKIGRRQYVWHQFAYLLRLDLRPYFHNPQIWETTKKYDKHPGKFWEAVHIATVDSYVRRNTRLKPINRPTWGDRLIWCLRADVDAWRGRNDIPF